MPGAQNRSPRDVLLDHLEQSKHGSVDVDLRRNYAENVIVLSGRGVHHGHEGIRQLAQLLREELPEGDFDTRRYLSKTNLRF